jgi:hypothetical protein
VLVLWAICTKLSDSHSQSQADFCKGAAIAVRRQLVLAAVAVVRWSKYLNVFFIMFGVFCASVKYIQILSQNKRLNFKKI